MNCTHKVILPNGVWTLPRGKRYTILELIARILGATCVKSTQNAHAWSECPDNPEYNVD